MRAWGANIAGDWDAVFVVVKRCNEVVLAISSVRPIAVCGSGSAPTGCRHAW